MEIKQLNKNEESVKIKVSLDAAGFDAQLDKAYQKNKDKFSLAGFRKGKVPRSVIEKNYGENVFYEDAINLTVSEAYGKFLDDNKEISPFTYPKIEVIKAEKESLEVSIEIPFAPFVKLGAYKGLKVKKVANTVKEEEIEEELKREQTKHARFEKTDAKSKLGDIVNIDFKGFEGGKAFEGGEAKGFDLELGSKSFIPGFEEGLVGLKAGEEKDVAVMFPKEYHAKALAGKEAVFKCKVNEVKQKHLPKLDDAFAKDASEFNTLEEFKNSIKNALQKVKDNNNLALTEQAVVDKIVENAKFSISPIVVFEESNYLINDIAQKLTYQGIDLEKYCSYIGTTVEEFKKSKLSEAEKIIKMRLVFREILALEKIEAKEEDIIARVIETNKTAKLDEKGAKNYFDKMSADKKEAVKNDALMQKLLNFLVENNLE